MMAPAMNACPEERLRYLDLAKQGARVSRRVQAATLPRLHALAPGTSEVAVELRFHLDAEGRPWVTGTAVQAVRAACLRCMEELDCGLEAAFSLCILKEGGEARTVGSDHDVLIVEGDAITIEDVVEDELLLALPERLCTVEPCPRAPALGFPAPAVQDEPESGHPFGILKRLKQTADS
jgi:uncharacterized protein